MNAEQANELDGDQRRRLADALMDAFPMPDEIQSLLYYEDDRWILPTGSRYSVIITQLLRDSRSEGRLHQLVNAAHRERPGNAMLRAFVETFEVSAVELVTMSASFDTHMLFDTKYFDLEILRKKVVRAVRTTAGPVLAFGLSYPDGEFLDKFLDWMESHFDQAQRKRKLNLLPELGKVPDCIRGLTEYMPDLESADVLCEICVIGASPDTLSTFWQAICEKMAVIERSLVLLLTGGNNTVFPRGVTVLPAPEFDIDDVDLWTHRLAEMKGWPGYLARAWTDLLHETSHYDGRLEVRSLYRGMDKTLMMIRTDEIAFRRQLEKRYGHAN